MNQRSLNLLNYGTSGHIAEHYEPFFADVERSGNPVAVINSDPGPFSDYSVNIGITTGHPLKQLNPSTSFAKLFAPTDGFTLGLVSSATELPIELNQYHNGDVGGVIRFDNGRFTQALFFHEPEQLEGDRSLLEFDGVRTVLRQHAAFQSSWFVGADTINTLAHRMAEPDITPDDLSRNVNESSLLAAVARHPLFTLKAAADVVGLNLESVDEVKARVDTWREMTQAWLDYHPETVEFDTDLLRQAKTGTYPETAIRFLASLQAVLGL